MVTHPSGAGNPHFSDSLASIEDHSLHQFLLNYSMVAAPQKSRLHLRPPSYSIRIVFLNIFKGAVRTVSLTRLLVVVHVVSAGGVTTSLYNQLATNRLDAVVPASRQLATPTRATITSLSLSPTASRLVHLL